MRKIDFTAYFSAQMDNLTEILNKSIFSRKIGRLTVQASTKFAPRGGGGKFAPPGGKFTPRGGEFTPPPGKFF